MTFSESQLRAAHARCSDHRREIESSEVCSCFYCCERFPSSEVEDWLEEGDGTALCPRCGIDAVIGSASLYPVSDAGFLRAMYAFWFARPATPADLIRSNAKSAWKGLLDLFARGTT